MLKRAAKYSLVRDESFFSRKRTPVQKLYIRAVCPEKLAQMSPFLALDRCFLGCRKTQFQKASVTPCVLSQRIFSYEAKLLALFVGEIFG